MRKHISIFTFLLSAFAAGLAFEAGAKQTVYGGYYYIGESFQDRSVERMVVKDSKPISYTVLNLAEGSAAVFKAYEPVGMKISNWGVVEHASLATSLILDPTRVQWKSTVSDEYEWQNETDVAEGAIAVKFDYVSYTIKFSSSQGGTMPADIATTYEKQVTIPVPTSTPTGYHFVKWIATSSFDPVYTNEFAAGVKATGANLGLDNCHVDGSVITLTAQWQANEYSLVCNCNGGAWPTGYTPTPSVSYDRGFSLPAPHRTGYDFDGWKVTSGLDTTTAKWGTGENPSTPVTADTRCFNGEKDVYFKNLNPTANASVTLTAQWLAKTIRVTFNNDGGSSGGGVLSFLDITYAAAYPAVDIPSKGGSLFRGYKINGSLYWDKNGQVQKPEWDIPTNCTAVAQWEAGDYELIYDENKGADSKQVRRKFEYDTPTELYDGADFSNLGCTLLGWSTSKQAEKPDDGCEIGGIKSFTESKTLYAVWEKNYFIVYDGNGATNETPMEVQKFIFGKSGQSLNPNIYGKVGYTFDGWATNRLAALLLDRSFRDREIITKDLAKTVGETNTLYAIWATNTYYVAFDPNGGTGAPMPVTPCKYDQPVTLPEATYSNGAYDFFGWSNDVEKVIYFKTDLTKSVSNLCAIADGTNTLYAVWKLSPLSAAMHCDNLRWESYQKTGEATRDNPWYPGSEGVYQYGDRSSHQQWLVAQVETDGTISFVWKPNLCEDRLDQMIFWIGPEKDAGETSTTKVPLKGVDGEWNSFVKADVPAGSFIHIYVRSQEGDCTIDQMTWTPDGPEPVAKDAVTIKTAAVSDGKFSLSFKSDEKFDYNLLTNADLLGGSWGVMGEKKIGNGSILTFEPQIIEGQPQMFYRVDTIQRK